jgi:hypothetical protein
MKTIKRFEVERDEKWLELSGTIPYLNFKNDWNVSITPPFGGAIARFRVKYKEKFISVYLDCFDSLGYMGEPYWEIYPVGDDETTARFLINETDELISAIDEELNR